MRVQGVQFRDYIQFRIYKRFHADQINENINE